MLPSDPLTLPESGGEPPKLGIAHENTPHVSWRCRIGRHDWRNGEYPEPMYEGVSSWAGTKHCRRCPAFRYWTPKEEAAYMRDTPWKRW